MRVAIVGCGQISRAHISTLRDIDGVAVTAVCDRDQWRAQETASLVSGARAYGSLGRLLQEEQPDTAHIVTPPATHAELAIQAMRAGCHVLVEKPMALSVQEADHMIVAARENRVRLCTNHNYLFKPSMLKARRLVQSGAIGQVVYVDSYYGLAGEASSYGGAGRSHWAWRLPGGAFTNFLPHLIYLQLAFLGQVESVAGVTLNGQPGEPATEMVILLRGGDASGTMVVSMRAKPYAKFVDIYGTAGILHVDLVREVVSIHRNRRVPRMLSKALFSLEDGAQLVGGTAGNTIKVALGRMKNMPELPVLFREFYRSIQDGSEPPVPGEEGRRMLEVLERVWEAAGPQLSHPSPVRTASVPASPKSQAERRVAREGLPGRALVTGATGWLGQCLVGALSRCGADVVALVRDKGRASLELERQAELVGGDVRDPASVAEAMDGVSVVFHCAAVITNRTLWSTHYETNVLGTKAVLDGALRAGAQRVVHVSTIVVYGLDRRRPNCPIEESAPYAASPDHWAFYLRSKMQADELALAFGREHGLAVTVLRLGILYGPGGGGSSGLGQLGPVRLLVGSGQNVLPYTYLDNAVDSLLLAAISPQAAGQAYNVVDTHVSVRELVLDGMRAAGRRQVLVPLPAFLLNGAASLLELKARLQGAERPPRLTRFVIGSYCRDLRYDTAKAREQLGWRPEVCLQEGLRRARQAAAR